MPSKRAAAEYLKFEVEHGRGDEPIHIVDIQKEQKKRIKNPDKSTRFVLVCDTPEAYSAMHAERDRIIKRCGNKSVAISLMIRAWQEALSDQALDRILAQLEAIENQ